jgi:hypothetical protein
VQITEAAQSGSGFGFLRINERDNEQAPIVFGIFLIAQLLDALLTYGGVITLGIDVEMNVLLASWMRTVGPGITLAVAKIIACLCGLFLYATARHRMLAIAAGLSLGVGVIPWCVVFMW